MSLFQLLSINVIIVLLGFFKGILINVQYIPAQAQYLTDHSAKSLIYVILAPLLTWFLISYFLRRIEIKKFIRFFLPAFSILALILLILISNPTNSSIYTISWIFIAGLISEFSRWGFMEVLDRYVNPTRAGTIASYHLLAAEIAVLFSSVFFQFQIFDKILFSTVATWISVLFIFLLLATLLNPRVLEIYYIRKKMTQPEGFRSINKQILVSLLLIGTVLGLFRMFQDNTSNTFFKHYYQNTDDLKTIISQVMFLGSIIQIITIFVSAKFLDKFRISPLKTLGIAWMFNLAFSIVAIVLNSPLGYVLYMSMPKGIAGLYYPALSRLTNSFKYNESITLNTIHIIGAVFVAGVIFAIVPTTMSLQYTFLIVLPFVAIFFLYYFKKRLEEKLLQGLRSDNLEEAVKAAVGLSYLQPLGYVKSLSEVLNVDSRRLLKKQILMALGYSQDKMAINILLEQFTSDKEEVQITVLEALKVARSFRSTRFVVDLLLSKKQSLTPRVRLSAAQMIVALYGKKSIPILLNGLDEEDPRVIANTIEALNHFQDKEVLELIKPFVNSDIPRVRGNSLIYVSKFKKEKELLETELEKTLKKSDINSAPEVISIFYVIGKVKYKKYKKELIDTLKQKETEFRSIQNENDIQISYFQTLLWALFRLGDEDAGTKLFSLMQSLSDKFQRRSVLHFYLQFDSSERYDLIDLWLKQSKNPDDTRAKLLEIFEESGLNLFEEVEYLKSLKFYRS